MGFASCANDGGGSGNGGGDAGYNKPVLPQSVGTNELAGRKLEYSSKTSYEFLEDTMGIRTNDILEKEFTYTYNYEKKEIYLSLKKQNGKTYSEWNDNTIKDYYKSQYEANKEKYNSSYNVTNFDDYLNAMIKNTGYSTYDEYLERIKSNLKIGFEGTTFYKYTLGSSGIVEKLEEFCDLSKQDWKTLSFRGREADFSASYGEMRYHNGDITYISTNITDTNITFKVSEKYKDNENAIKDPFSFNYVVNKNENTVTIKDIPKSDGTKKDCVLEFKGNTLTINGASK